MINIIVWLIAGAVIGWLFTIITRRRHPILLLNIIVGSVGAVMAGYLLPRVFHISDETGFSWLVLLVAVGGSILLLAVVNFFARERSMNDSVIEGHWAQVRDKIHSRWPKITEEDAERINGDHDRLINLIVERYGIAQEEAEDQLQRYLSAVVSGVS